MSDFKDRNARLRKTFHYPADDGDSQPEAIDEQEQEAVIERLASENQSRNATFRLFLLPVPLTATLPYLLSGRIFSSLALLSLTSLLSTAYLLYIQPPDSTGIPFLDALARPKPANPAAAALARRLQDQRRAAAAPLGIGDDESSPLQKYLPYLTLALCGIVAVMGAVAHSRDPTPQQQQSRDWILRGNLPAVVHGVVLVSKTVMASVDPEAELGALRYGYKGA